MAELLPFSPAKLIIGIIASQAAVFSRTEEAVAALYGPVDVRSEAFPFELTDYYSEQMGKGLLRQFLGFSKLVPPESLSDIKVRTNALEELLRESLARPARVVNIDPGILTPSALIMATAKNFAHRVPLKDGVYAHLELLFSKDSVRLLPWTYPDFKQEGYQGFFLETRRVLLRQLRRAIGGPA
jgi:hypothetical protein